MVLTVGYDRESLTDPKISQGYHGPVTTDYYGRKVPKHAHGTANLHRYTSSTKLITDAVMELYDRIMDPGLLVRRINLTAAGVIRETDIPEDTGMEQLDLFADDAVQQQKEAENAQLAREKRRQKAVLDIRKKFGKNAILKGMNYKEGATARDRNSQIGGHKA